MGCRAAGTDLADRLLREGAKLIPPPIGDRYEDEAYRLLELKRGKRDLFGEEA